MNIYFLRYSILCIISFLSVMSYAIADTGPYLRFHNNIQGKDLIATQIHLAKDYSIDLEDKENIYSVLSDVYPKIEIWGSYQKHDPFVLCSFQNVTIDSGYFTLTIDYYANRPDEATCTLNKDRQKIK